MAKLYNLARMTTATVGTGTITLGSAVSGYLSFASAGVANGETVAYGIKDGANSEVGTGTYTSAGTTLTRTVTKSTNSDAAITLSGTAEVYITARKEDLLSIAETQTANTVLAGPASGSPAAPTFRALGAADYVAAMLGSGMCLVNGTLTAAVAVNALTIAIKNKAGNDPSASDPVHVIFRNATAATGDYALITLTAATSLVISSGSTLGAASATAFKLWIVGFNDGGTFRLGAIKCVSGVNVYPLGQFPIASSIAEGGAGAADSAQVFYTGTAVTSKAYQVLGYMSWESGLTTAGTWDATPTRIQLFGYTVPLPGSVIQQQMNFDGTLATGTTTIPQDDTIPQNTEGTQFQSQAITPTSAANLLQIDSIGIYGVSVVSAVIIAALFQDTTANALAANAVRMSSTSGQDAIILRYVMLAATTSATTFKVRAGGSAASTVSFNGITGTTQVFGGVSGSSISVKEIVG